jgi:hypothetical protein
VPVIMAASLVQPITCTDNKIRKPRHAGRDASSALARCFRWMHPCIVLCSDRGARLAHLDEKGAILGKYQRRGDATKAIAEMAYRPESKR